MAVSKRVRFEILRRDAHTCQYCGAKAPDAVLQIDHVVPVSLGGDDKPSNLVTACSSCNGGKTSIAPGSPLVEGLGDRAAAYALGMTDKMTRLRGMLEGGSDFCSEFEALWNSWTNGLGENIPLPPDYELSVQRWFEMGVPLRLFEMAIPKAMHMKGGYGEFPTFSYMAGIITKKINDIDFTSGLTPETAAVYTTWQYDEAVEDAHRMGWIQGRENGMRRADEAHEARDLLAAHIDGRLAVAGA